MAEQDLGWNSHPCGHEENRFALALRQMFSDRTPYFFNELQQQVPEPAFFENANLGIEKELQGTTRPQVATHELLVLERWCQIHGVHCCSCGIKQSSYHKQELDHYLLNNME